MEHGNKYLFRVVHPNHGEGEVTAGDRYSAVVAAAKEWGLRWTTIAKDCNVHQLGKAKAKK